MQLITVLVTICVFQGLECFIHKIRNPHQVYIDVIRHSIEDNQANQVIPPASIGTPHKTKGKRKRNIINHPVQATTAFSTPNSQKNEIQSFIGEFFKFNYG